MLPLAFPGLAERALAVRDGALLRRAMRAMRASPVPDAEVEPYVAAAREAGWLRGGVNVYRAMAAAAIRRLPALGRLAGRARGARGMSRVDVPVLVIWGTEDPFLGDHLAEPPVDRVPHARVVRIAGASHDVMLDAPDRVNALLLDFLEER
jgi:pimeloyl-ACP methyl ester carboxylesterase